MIDIRWDDVSVVLDGTPIITELKLHVPAASWLAVIGPNGAGKTTLMRALVGAVHHEGQIRVGVDAVASLDRRSLARLVAYVPQLPYIPRAMTVTDYVLMGRTPYIPYFGMETANDLDVVGEVLDRLDLSELGARQLGSLSGGELQRVILGRALAQQAPVLILDEPTSALDVGHQQHVLELVDALRKEKDLTVVTAMHDLTLAGQFADRLVLLRAGRIVAEGTAAQVLTETTINSNYDARVRVVHENGTVVVVPTRAGGEPR